MIDALLDGLRRRNRRALARLLTLAARGDDLPAIDAALLSSPVRPTRVIALTGSAGVGKSTLAGKLIEKARQDGQTVAVLACDPQSPLTGGALLGDRFRMNAQDEDSVFIRSLATPGGSEAIAPHLPTLIRLLQVFGFDFILLETVGAGQGDTAVRRLADRVVLLLQPETGDDLQWEKAGLVEVADIIVVHKGDLPGAERTLAQVKAALELSTQRDTPQVLVSSRSGTGIDDLYYLLKETSPRPHDDRRDLPALARDELETRLRGLTALSTYRELDDAWRTGTLDEVAARQRVWQLLNQSP